MAQDMRTLADEFRLDPAADSQFASGLVSQGIGHLDMNLSNYCGKKTSKRTVIPVSDEDMAVIRATEAKKPTEPVEVPDEIHMHGPPVATVTAPKTVTSTPTPKVEPARADMSTIKERVAAITKPKKK